MKKILATISLAAVATLVQAQGYIEYYGGAANVTTNTATVNPGSPASGKIGNSTSGQLYYFELLYTSSAINGSSAPTNSAWSPVLANGGGALALGTNAPGPGNMWGPGNSGGVQVNLAAGTAYSVELVGWSAGLGTFSQAMAAITAGGASVAGQFLGWTPVGSLTPFATAGAGDPTLFPSTWVNGTLVLNQVPIIVPEPGTLALAALGGASLLLFRRKK